MRLTEYCCFIILLRLKNKNREVSQLDKILGKMVDFLGVCGFKGYQKSSTRFLRLLIFDF